MTRENRSELLTLKLSKSELEAFKEILLLFKEMEKYNKNSVKIIVIKNRKHITVDAALWNNKAFKREIE